MGWALYASVARPITVMGDMAFGSPFPTGNLRQGFDGWRQGAGQGQPSARQIEIKDVASYFGKVSLKGVSKLDRGTIEADVVCSFARRPASLVVRLPHPEQRIPLRVEGGVYDPKTESVKISGFRGQAHIRLTF